MACQRTGNIAAVTLSSIALVLFVVSAWTLNASQNLQQQFNERQAQINNGVQISQLNNELVRALGTAVISKNDTKIKDLLSQYGITVSLDKDAKGAAAPAAKKPAAAPAAAQ